MRLISANNFFSKKQLFGTFSVRFCPKGTFHSVIRRNLCTMKANSLSGPLMIHQLILNTLLACQPKPEIDAPVAARSELVTATKVPTEPVGPIKNRGYAWVLAIFII